ncbi:dachshund homolog 1-like [Ostrinia nubilalis]|uniref:dachshund homolog 1-like n=1 Tax=Ostrinia nubilalis TaxID=29057 RepID=UPI0030824FB0
MQSATVFFLALVAVVAAGGQFYVPRAYYTIDAEGHASHPVPLRRLRRSFNPYPYGSEANANANANAEANSWGGGSASANANAHANANAGSGGGGWGLPSFRNYGSANPNALSAGMTRRMSGPVSSGRSVLASSSVGMDSSGNGYYDQYTSVSH